MAYFLIGKYISFFFSLSVFKDAWCFVRRLRMALVFLGRRSRGKYFLFLYTSLSADFCFCDITVNTCAIVDAITDASTLLHLRNFASIYHHRRRKRNNGLFYIFSSQKGLNLIVYRSRFCGLFDLKEVVLNTLLFEWNIFCG